MWQAFCWWVDRITVPIPRYLTVTDAFKAKIKETGKQVPNFKTEVFFQQEKQDDPTLRADALSLSSKMPSRMASDQMINIFFQEWASLFPVLHRPTILEIYSEFVADPKDVKDQHAIAQLYLIYGIAALSAEVNLTKPNDLCPYMC